MNDIKPLRSRTMGVEELQSATLKLIRQVRKQLNRAPHEEGLSDKEFDAEVLGELETKIRNDRDVLKLAGGREIDPWTERYAELLGCLPRPHVIAASIDSLKSRVDEAMLSIPLQREAARDSVIHQMRNQAVNCGMRNHCAVAGWFKTSEELAAETNSDESDEGSES